MNGHRREVKSGEICQKEAGNEGNAGLSLVPEDCARNVQEML